ncbi:glycosyltransferase [Salinisphaera sp. SPP-AMP-43]|uniref:glycosyltransferase n=1 Tax=Salinisphaera sp. SPP-AMP-43 TaxID=3121288 RepID=UPI003C6E370E
MRIGHVAALRTIGGAEHHLAQFVRLSRLQHGVDHAVCSTGRYVHPHIAATIAEHATVHEPKRIGPIKLPRQLSTLRRLRLRQLATQMNIDVALFWNRLGSGEDALRESQAFDGQPRIYWDRGACWLAKDGPAEHRFLSRMQGILANSQACRRMLELRWGYTGNIQVCRNALRPDLLPMHAATKRRPHNRPLRIGIAARLVPVKGIASSLYCLHALRRRGVDAELHIAGTGPLFEPLQSLAARLGIRDHVVFHGLLADMAGFYRRIDCLLHLALREPFGGVIVEAMAYGCPVVATRVDGIAEIIEHGRDGFLLEPELEAPATIELCRQPADLPPWVYQPATDSITAPRSVAPATAADAIERLLADDARFAEFSHRAKARARHEFDYADHVAGVLEALSELATARQAA